MNRFVAVLLLALGWICFGNPAEPSPLRGQNIARLEIPGVENGFQVSDKIISGGTPKDDQSFAALARLGVRTIISVDGAAPEAERARKHGLRYVHFPIGYNGVFGTNAQLLVKAAQLQEGKVFIHCHHGQHRGPAAAAVICATEEKWSSGESDAWLKAAGTSTDYPGLYRMVEEFKAPTPNQLLGLTNTFSEKVATPDFVAAMVEIDEHWEALKPLMLPAAGTPSAGQQETMGLLTESYRELLRSPNTKTRDIKLQQALVAAEQLSFKAQSARTGGSRDGSDLRAALRAVGKSCKDCHERFRN